MIFEEVVETSSQWWEIAWAWLNEPLPIIGMSVLMICCFALTIFVKSSLGKKSLNKMKDMVGSVKVDFEDTKKQARLYQEEAKKIIEQQSAKISYLESLIKQMCDLSRNKKVKEIASKIEEQQDEEKK